MSSGNRLHIRHGNATVSVCLHATEYNQRVGHIIANAKNAAFDDLIEAVQAAQTAYQLGIPMTEPCPSTFFKTPCTLSHGHTGEHANLDPGYEIMWTDQAADQQADSQP